LELGAIKRVKYQLNRFNIKQGLSRSQGKKHYFNQSQLLFLAQIIKTMSEKRGLIAGCALAAHSGRLSSGLCLLLSARRRLAESQKHDKRNQAYVDGTNLEVVRSP
jgi:hypothetical protein